MTLERANYTFAGPATSSWCVMVLAHNEDRRITACLDSIFEEQPGRVVDVYVMANGCSDRTEDLVRKYRETHPTVHLVSIELGDKCNAWNVFVHETVPKLCKGRDIYFFMDGDARIIPGSLSALELGLRANPRAHAATAPPSSGRSLDADRRELIRGRHLVANLYALRGSFVRRLQEEKVRLPLKLEGDDGLLGILIKWDLRPQEGRIDDSLIEPCPAAGFVFDSVDWRMPSEWFGYWKRLVRYGRRGYEFQLLGRRLREYGMGGLPTDISTIYAGSESLCLRWQGIMTLTNWVALQGMRREARAQVDTAGRAR